MQSGSHGNTPVRNMNMPPRKSAAAPALPAALRLTLLYNPRAKHAIEIPSMKKTLFMTAATGLPLAPSSLMALLAWSYPGTAAPKTTRDIGNSKGPAAPNASKVLSTSILSVFMLIIRRRRDIKNSYRGARKGAAGILVFPWRWRGGKLHLEGLFK